MYSVNKIVGVYLNQLVILCGLWSAGRDLCMGEASVVGFVFCHRSCFMALAMEYASDV